MKKKAARLDSDAPAYKAVANELRAAIQRRQYPPGQRLPTEDELVERYQLSRQTIRRAFQELMSDGLIFRVRRRGTFAIPASGPFLRSFGSAEDMVNLPNAAEVEILDPLHVVSKGKLDAVLGGAGQYWTLLLRHFDAGKIILVSEISLAKGVGETLAKEPAIRTAGHRGHFSIIGLVDKYWADGVSGVSQTIYPLASSKRLAATLGCKTGEPILMAERLYHDAKNNPVEFARTFFHPQNYIFRAVMRR